MLHLDKNVFTQLPCMDICNFQRYSRFTEEQTQNPRDT